MEIRELSKKEFSFFTENYPYSSIYQTTEYGDAMIQEGYKTLYVGAIENNRICAASLIIIKKIKGYNYGFAPRGFLIDFSNEQLLTEFTKELKKFLSKKDVVAIKMSPLIIKDILNDKGEVLNINNSFQKILDNLNKLGYYHYGFNNFFEAEKPRFEAVLDINKDYRVLFKNIKKEYKTKIRSAELKGIKIYRASVTEMGYLYDVIKTRYSKDIRYLENIYNIYSRNNKMEFYYAKLDTEKYLRRVKYLYETQEKRVYDINNYIISKKTKNSPKMLSRKIEADRQLSIYKEQLIEATNFIREYPTGIVLASVLIAKHRSEISIYLDGFDTKYKSFSAKHLIIWKLIEKYSKEGYKLFNFGGITDIRIKDSRYNGLNSFKMNFGCGALEYLGDLELVTNSPKYFLYRQTLKLTGK